MMYRFKLFSLYKKTLEPCIKSIAEFNDFTPILLAEAEKYVIH